LYELQGRELSLDETNPFYFPEPVAPLVATRKKRRGISLAEAVARMRSVVAGRGGTVKHQTSNIKLREVLIEGSGGLLVPLGPGYTVLDLIVALKCEVIVVARNKLGTINHTLLTVRALQETGVKKVSVALMGNRRPDFSSQSNPEVLSELLTPVPVRVVPFLGGRVMTVAGIKRHARRLEKILGRFVQEAGNLDR
jgi:dethiobiotin synthetase